MRKLLVSSSLALLALVLTASLALAAPRVAPGSLSTDLSVKVNPYGIGIVYDSNRPHQGNGMRLTVEGGLESNYFELGASLAWMFPLVKDRNLQLGFFLGPQAGVDDWFTGSEGVYLGAVAGLALDVPLDSRWLMAAEVAYAPAVGFYPGYQGYVYHGGYGLYFIYKTDSGLGINAGVRSMGWLPGLYVGVTF